MCVCVWIYVNKCQCMYAPDRYGCIKKVGMQDRRGLLKMLLQAIATRPGKKNQRNYFSVEETDIVKRQEKSPGPLRFIQL